MQRKRRLIILLAIVGIALTLQVLLTNFAPQNIVAQTTEGGDQTQITPPEDIPRPELVVPETPLGPLGLVSAMAAGFGVFTLINRRK